MEIEDAIKLVYQHTFGMDMDIDIEAEYRAAQKDPADYLCEDIGGGYYRVHLNGIPSGNLTIEKLADILTRSRGSVNESAGGAANESTDGADASAGGADIAAAGTDLAAAGAARAAKLQAEFEANLDDLYSVVREGYFNFDYKDYQKFMNNYIDAGYPALEHSSYFINQYEPHYVVVRQDILNAEKTSFSKVFLRIYDKKVQSGEVTFSKIGVPKPLFVVICNNQNYVPTDELLEKLRVNLKLNEQETRELYESAGRAHLLG